MNFLRLGLKARIYSGFSILVLMGLALAGFGAWELSGIKADVQRLSAINDNATRALEASKRIEIIRRANLRYMVDADDESIKDAAAAESSASELLKLAADSTPTLERRNAYNTIRSEIDAMRGKRETLMGLVKQMRADRAKLFSGGDELTSATDKLMQSRTAISERSILTLFSPVESSVLLVRVANWRFLATRDAKGPATFKANTEHAAAALAALEKTELPDSVRAFIGPVKAALAAYAASFDALAANMLKSDDLFWKNMVPQAVNMLAKIGTVQQQLKQVADSAKADTMAAIDSTVSTQMIVGGLALVLGVLIAWIVSRSIIKPVAGMTGAMQRLAAGDNEVEIPSRDSRDEIGAMAKAVEVFKQNAIERIRLEAEQHATEARTAADKRSSEERAAAEKHAAAEREEAARKAAIHKLADSVRSGGRRHHRQCVVGLDRTRSRSQYADQDRRDHPAALRRGRVGLRGSLRQRPVGRLGDRGDDRLGRRDQPAGAGIEQDRRRSGQAGGRRPTHASPNCRRRRAASATWSS